MISKTAKNNNNNNKEEKNYVNDRFRSTGLHRQSLPGLRIPPRYQRRPEREWSVFFFYPADFTFVCPTELADLQNKYADFKKLGCEIFSVSCDTHFVHKAWADASETIKNIEYPMLADAAHVLARDFDVLIEDAGLSERGTFIVNPEGKIVAYEVVAGNIGRNADELLRRVEALQFVAEHGDQVCPAKWQPGAETLKPGLDLIGKL